MICPACRHDNRSGARFCEQCAGALARRCTFCGAPVPPSATVCDRCARPTEPLVRRDTGALGPLASYTPRHLAARILRSRSALEGERKQVTVLFCDLVDSTALAERLGSDAMHRLLDRFFTRALHEIHRYEGTVNQFLGDGLMALFGAPVAHEQHARQAMLAAQAVLGAVHEELMEFRERDGVQVAIRIALNTGPVVVGKIGDDLRMDYTAIGDTTNTAARLQQMADVDTVLISDTTLAAAGEDVEVEFLGLRTLKGKSEPVRVYKLVAVRPRTGDGSRRLRSQLVGRARETRTLERCLAALSRGEGGIVFLVGEPGVGKSRLIAEARRAAIAGELLWLEGRSLSFTQTISYWPLIEIIRRYAGIGEDDDTHHAWPKLEARVSALFGPESPGVLPYLGTLLGLAVPQDLKDRVRYLDERAMGRQVLLTSRRLFERLAQQHAVVLVFEDLHWIDESAAELLEHLMPLVAGVPLLLCLAMRPERAGPAARLRALAAERHPGRFTEISLGPLSTLEGQNLIANLLQHAPSPGLEHLILAKAEGNPFFIEEVIRALIALQAIARDESTGGWRPTARLDHITIPDTIQGVIMARIDRLDDDLKQVLKLAAVIGRSFFYRVLRGITETERELDHHLVELQAVELIREKRPVPEREYVFRHGLVQEATYDSILVERRRALHGAVGTVIERLFADRLDEFAGLLGYHYARAEEWEKAKDYLSRAGDHAGRLAADAEALAHYREAFAACERVLGARWEPLQRATLERKMGEALFRRGDHYAAVEFLKRALGQLGYPLAGSRWGVRFAIFRELVRQLRHRLLGVPRQGPEDSAVEERERIYDVLGWIDYFMDQERVVLDSLLILNTAERARDPLRIVKGCTALGMIFDLLRCFRLAERYHRRAVALAQAVGDPGAAGWANLGIGVHEYQRGQTAAAHAHFQLAVTAYHDTGDLHAWGGAATMTAWVLRQTGQLATSLALSQDIVRVGEGTADDQVLAWGLHGLGRTLWHTGAFDEAAAALARAIELYRTVPDYPAIAEATSDLAQCWLRQGRLAETQTALDECSRTIADRRLRGVVCTRPRLALAEALLAAAEAETAGRRRSLSRARRACRAALRQANMDRQGLPAACRLAGIYWWLRGSRVRAERWWSRAVAAATEMGARYELGVTYLESGRRTRLHDLLNHAELIFTEIGARHDLARTRRAFLEIGLADKPAA
jgi:class 3 adenylate cyclase/tetratricopeptide (TPR) repeat protein